MKLDTETYNRLVENNTRYLIKFSAKWCGPCRTYAPIFEEFRNSNEIECFDVDCDEQKDLVTKYEILSIPTTLLLEGDKVLKSQSKIMTLENLKEFAFKD